MGGANFGQAAPPWQLWGNTQVITVAGSPFTDPNATDKNQTLVRISYGRPETWRFLFGAKLISAPSAFPLAQANASVWFEAIIGIGRAAIKIPFFKSLAGWNWNNSTTQFVLNQLQWSTRADDNSTAQIILTDAVSGDITTFGSVAVPVDLLVAQDLTVNAVVSFTTDLPPPTEIQVEVTAMFAPVSHVRPDWALVDADPSEQFPGGETGGR